MQYFSKALSVCYLTLLATSVFIISPHNSAHAADAATFLKGLDGSYRGRGKAFFMDGKKAVNVSCRIANEVSADGSSLKVTGVCATTQGKANVNGELQVKGKKITGAFFSPSANMKLTKSHGEVKGRELIVISYFVDSQSGALTQIKQIVQKNGRGFSSHILTYDNASKKYQQSGTIKFKKKK